MQSLSKLETYLCSLTAGALAASILPRDPMPEFAGMYGILFAVSAFTFWITFMVLLLILKNHENWWGW